MNWINGTHLGGYVNLDAAWKVTLMQNSNAEVYFPGNAQGTIIQGDMTPLKALLNDPKSPWVDQQTQTYVNIALATNIVVTVGMGGKTATLTIPSVGTVSVTTYSGTQSGIQKILNLIGP